MKLHEDLEKSKYVSYEREVSLAFEKFNLAKSKFEQEAAQARQTMDWV